jgi:DNA-binding transcriptional ArsR family regulator
MNTVARRRAKRLEDAADSLYARFFSGFADETRLRIIRTLLEGPLTVGEIVAQLEISQSRISNHLACLRWCGFVQAERQGKYMIYKLADRDIAKIMRLAQRLVSRNAEHLAGCVQL